MFVESHHDAGAIMPMADSSNLIKNEINFTCRHALLIGPHGRVQFDC